MLVVWKALNVLLRFSEVASRDSVRIRTHAIHKGMLLIQGPRMQIDIHAVCRAIRVDDTTTALAVTGYRQCDPANS